jgi:hypothetical protein
MVSVPGCAGARVVRLIESEGIGLFWLVAWNACTLLHNSLVSSLGVLPRAQQVSIISQKIQNAWARGPVSVDALVFGFRSRSNFVSSGACFLTLPLGPACREPPRKVTQQISPAPR